MTTPAEPAKANKPTLAEDLLALARHYLGGRRALILLAVAVISVGAALSWGWLVAIGIAPLLLTLAPCAAMCALGLCMKGGGKSCSPGGQKAGGDTRKDDA